MTSGYVVWNASAAPPRAGRRSYRNEGEVALGKRLAASLGSLRRSSPDEAVDDAAPDLRRIPGEAPRDQSPAARSRRW